MTVDGVEVETVVLVVDDDLDEDDEDDVKVDLLVVALPDDRDVVPAPELEPSILLDTELPLLPLDPITGAILLIDDESGVGVVALEVGDRGVERPPFVEVDVVGD